MSSHGVPISEIKACAKAQGVEFQYGDILIIRYGWTEAYHKMNEAERAKFLDVSQHAFVGLQASEESLDFIHDNYFAAVAGDAPSFEKWPFNRKEVVLHDYLLPRWGCPIGELWDLEALSETCKRLNRYTFLLTSSPANVSGGVGTHPNALALF